MGNSPELAVEQDLRRLKQLVETGETATIQGQPSGDDLGRARKARWNPVEHRDEEQLSDSARSPEAPPSSENSQSAPANDSQSKDSSHAAASNF